jgi:Na+/H+-dicarboxylate symporter
MKPSSRIATARRNVRIAQYAIGGTAAVALAAFAAAARVAHPGTHSVRSGQAATATSATATASSSEFFGDDSSIGPSGSATPQVQTGGS